MFFGYYSLIVYNVQAVYITLFLRNRDLVTFYCCFTHMLSEILNYILKHILKVPRPSEGPPGGGLFEGRYGMPSQHCHCFAYLFTIVLLLTFHYYKHHISSAKKVMTFVVSILALTLQVLGRIYLKFHTWDQCLGGIVFGSLSALIFYAVGLKFFLRFSDYLCNLSLLSFFSFRKDLVSSRNSKPLTKKQIKRY